MDGHCGGRDLCRRHGYKHYRLHYPKAADVHGSAAFMDRRAVAALTRGDGLIIGREIKPSGKPGRLLRDDGPAHLLTLAPTRSGKGVGAIIPNLLTADRSVLCIDPKGENARATYHGPPPVRASPCPRSLRRHRAPRRRIQSARPSRPRAASTLPRMPPPSPTPSSMTRPAKSTKRIGTRRPRPSSPGSSCSSSATSRRSDRTLATVRDYLTLAPDAFADLLELMQDSPAADGLIARAANRHLGKADREAAGVLSSAQRHTHFLDSPRMAAVMARSDFRFAELKAQTATVFLVLPPDRLDTYSRWLRLMVAQAITDMARSPVQPPSPVLFLLDEFAALGPLEPVVRAYGLMAGYGMQLWAILQDLHQLKSLYGPRAGTFLSNAGVTQVFNVNDVETAAWVSRTLGATTEAYETTSQSFSYGKDAPSWARARTEVPRTWSAATCSPRMR